MADDRRIIKGWTDEERRELEEYKKEPKSSMLKVFYDLFSGYEFYPIPRRNTIQSSNFRGGLTNE